MKKCRAYETFLLTGVRRRVSVAKTEILQCQMVVEAVCVYAYSAYQWYLPENSIVLKVY